MLIRTNGAMRQAINIVSEVQIGIPTPNVLSTVLPFKTQLLKWVGNKQRFAHEIASTFPVGFGTYFEPFLGSGAVLGTLAPLHGVASDAFVPLIGIWQTLETSPETLIEWYTERWNRMKSGDKVTVFEEIKASYNESPNAADLLFLSRSCYGGVVRFRKADGYISTPCGVHAPVSPESFSSRVAMWKIRTSGTRFMAMDFAEAMELAVAGDVIYCDPPYTHSQTILYGAQAFSLGRLFQSIADCKERGVQVVLSIDGSKRSGKFDCELPIPQDLFEREYFVNCGRSMLRRFQMGGQSLEGEVVADRLLLTY
jgi:DNA adenine methylase